MGREIRRVPQGWEHPCDERTGRYIPLYDYDYESKAREWIAKFQAWESGAETFPNGDPIAPKKEYCKYYWEYANVPDEETCRPKFDAEPTCYQVYETVTEGTPVSPVFETLDAMTAWLVKEGYSRVAAEEFAQTGWAMSAAFNMSTGEFASDIETYSMCRGINKEKTVRDIDRTDNGGWPIAYVDVAEYAAMRQRAEAAEARVRELEALLALVLTEA